MKKANLLFTLTLFSLTAFIAQATNQTYGPIKSGELLWNIAAQVQEDPSLSRYQVMLALLKTNPHAFEISCNMNSLKVGQKLRIPALAEMQATSRAEAVKEFYRQQEEWKAYRRHQQKIVCPQLPATKEPEQPFLSAIKKVIYPETTAATTSPVEKTALVSEPTIPNINHDQAISSLSTTSIIPPTHWETFLLQLPAQFPLPIMLSLLLAMMVLLFLVLLRGKRRRKPVNNSSVSTNHHFSNDPLEKMPLPTNAPGNQIAQHEEAPFNQTSSSPELSPTETTSLSNQKTLSEQMEEKLENVRAFLAEDEALITQRLLREVIQSGTREQQAEARQLYEINKKINHLKQQATDSPPAVPKSSIQEPSDWHELVEKEHWPLQQYLPENKEKVFGLIDKIFELLDYELNAQGKLVKAYVDRHRQEFLETENYNIMGKEEKWVAEHEKESSVIKPRSELKPTRRL